MPTTHPNTINSCPPNILFFAGHDPSGGAGLSADITTAALLGCHACPIMTAVTAQNTQTCSHVHMLPPEIVYAQLHAVLAEFSPSVIKLSLLGDCANAPLFEALSRQYPHTPILCDPVLQTTTGTVMTPAQQYRHLTQEIFPFCTLITPNMSEARQLTGCHLLDDIATALLKTGTQALLLTGDREGIDMCHHLYIHDQQHDHTQYARLRCPHLTHEFHGAGCTLTAAIASYLARGETLTEAIVHGQDWCFQALSDAYHRQHTQAIPYRLQRHYHA